MRAICAHDHVNFIKDNFFVPHKITVETERDDPYWTSSFLNSFAQPNPKYYVDHDHAGWLVWSKEFQAYKVDTDKSLEYDDVEIQARETIGKQMNREWFNTFFSYLKQEPRDGVPDRFRMASSMLLQFAFDLVREGATPVVFEEITEETTNVLGDGSDKHQHRATAEILGALVCSYRDSALEKRTKMWDYVFPIIRKTFEDGLTPENSSYWTSFIHLIFVCISTVQFKTNI